MAALVLRPAMLEFVDMVNMAPDMRIEELVVGERSRWPVPRCEGSARRTRV